MNAPGFMASYGFPQMQQQMQANQMSGPGALAATLPSNVQPGQSPTGPPTGYPGVQGIQDTSGQQAAFQAAQQRFAQLTGQPFQAPPQMHGTQMNPIAAAILGGLGFAANQENRRLMLGSQGVNTALGAIQNRSNVDNQNAMAGYQNDQQNRQAQINQAGLESQQAGQNLQTVLGQNSALREDALKRYTVDQNIYSKGNIQDKKGEVARDVANIKVTGAQALQGLKNAGQLDVTKLKNVFRVNPGADRKQAALDAGYDEQTANALASANPKEVQQFAQANNINDLISDRQATRPYRIANLATTNDRLAASIDQILAGTGRTKAETEQIVQRVNFYPEEFQARIAALGASTLKNQALAEKAQQFGTTLPQGQMLRQEATTLGREASINQGAIKNLMGMPDATQQGSENYQKLMILTARQSQIADRLKEIGSTQSGQTKVNLGSLGSFNIPNVDPNGNVATPRAATTASSGAKWNAAKLAQKMAIYAQYGNSMSPAEKQTYRNAILANGGKLP